MNKFRKVILLAVMALVLVGAGLVKAQEGNPQGPTPQMVEEICATRGAALLKYHPQYTAIRVPVTGENPYFRQHNAPTAEMIEEIARTRGAALRDFWLK